MGFACTVGPKMLFGPILGPLAALNGICLYRWPEDAVWAHSGAPGALNGICLYRWPDDAVGAHSRALGGLQWDLLVH